MNENSNGAINTKIIAIMQRVGAIGKNRENESQHYNFRGIDDVFNALQPALIENGVFVVPTVASAIHEVVDLGQKKTHKAIITYRFKFVAAEDGSFVEVETVGEALDYSDKASNKAASFAFKYACFILFCIPTQEFIDGDLDYITDQPNGAPKQTTGSATAARSTGGARKPSGTAAPRSTGTAPKNTAAKTGGAKSEQINAINNLSNIKGVNAADYAKLASKKRTEDPNELTFDEAADAIKTLSAL